MGHRTLINGTAYTVKSGTAKIDGTGYRLYGGRTMVGGTSHNIKLSYPVQVTVTTKNASANNWGHVLIEGKKRTEGTFELERGTSITLVAGGSSNSVAKIFIDGHAVAEKKYGTQGMVNYEYLLMGNCNIVINRSSSSEYGSKADVTLKTL